MNRIAGVAAFALFASMSACDNGAASDDPGANASEPIRGGSIATNPEAALVDMISSSGGGSACSGAIIAPRVVLTAGHCVDGFVSWTVTAPNAQGQRASSRRGVVYDYRSTGNVVNNAAHDVGLIILDSPINLSSYPSVASSPSPDGTQVYSVGRKLNGVLSSSTLYASQVKSISSGAPTGRPNAYVAPPTVEPGDSGGPVLLANARTIVAVNSGISPVDETLARVDQVFDFISQQIAATGGGGGGGGGGGQQCVDTNANCGFWASVGECSKNPNYMLTSCCASCGGAGGGGQQQCVDTNANCDFWASVGECSNNPNYMLTSCCGSCRARGF